MTSALPPEIDKAIRQFLIYYLNKEQPKLGYSLDKKESCN